jgi:flagellar protein FliJ
MADGLESLLRLRHSAVAAAHSALSAALQAAGQASEASREAERAVQRELRLVADSDGDDDMVEAFARWLPLGHARAESARARERLAEAEVERCRAELTSSQVALKIVEDLHAERRAAATRERLAQEQKRIDEIRPARGTA